MKRYDVIVVGAGPAGSTAARVCSNNGLKTLLLEKEKIPREKRCAGGISNRALKEIDFELPEGIIERRCIGMRVVHGRLRNEVTTSATVASMVIRTEFDACLTEKAKESGAEIRDSEACESVKLSKEHALVKTNKGHYLANIVIGADGVYSKVAEVIRPKFSRKEMRFCIIAEVPMAEGRIDEITHNLVELHYGYISSGYAWAFPKKNYISFGIGGAFAQSKMLKEKFKEFLKLYNISNNVVMKSWIIPISDFRYNCYTDRIMIAGDAAGFVDSFSGEGIRLAIASGRMAAGTAVRAHCRSDFSKNSLKSYQKEFYSKFKDDLVWSIKMTGFFFRFPNLILGTVLMNREVILKYFKVMSGEVSFKHFSKWVIVKLPGIIFKRFLRWQTC